MSKCGQEHVEIISQLGFTVTGLGTAYIDPYEFVCGGESGGSESVLPAGILAGRVSGGRVYKRPGKVLPF